MKVCVLLPDYSTTDVDYKHYDPVRNLQPLLPNDVVDTVLLNKLTVYKQLKTLSKKGYDIFVNLCEAYLEWEVPGVEVIYYMDMLGLPYTGPTQTLYDPTKTLMKYVAYCEGVATPKHIVAKCEAELNAAQEQLSFPLFVKPVKAGDSLGIDAQSKVVNYDALIQQCKKLWPEYDELLIEEYVKGEEYTVLVIADGQDVRALQPVQYKFDNNNEYKTYALKTSELHTEANVLVEDEVLCHALQNAAKKIFTGFNGKGYARLDFRVAVDGTIHFLEINFTCSVFYTNGMEGSADYILKLDGLGQADFLKMIIADGLTRYSANQKCYEMRGNSIAGYGIFANRDIAYKELIFNLEEAPQRIATLPHIQQNWNAQQKEIFKKYAYAVSNEVFLLWSNNPAEWAPQNHSCNANTAYQGLNVVAKRAIQKGEELTLDYTTFLDDTMEPFVCTCGAAGCKGLIKGQKGNTISARAAALLLN
jgi:D-alanine-D-alanine ligase